LLLCAAPIVEGDNPLGEAWQVGDDEPDARNKPVPMPLDLAMVDAINWKSKISAADILRTYTPHFIGEATYLTVVERQLRIAQVQEEMRKRGMTVPPGLTPAPAAPAIEKMDGAGQP
jgi:hypothetical protein